uniref:Uncharacterized protein n=1 Tax=Callorhinchus milii TaxID=7868 RepID=A0A4W3HF16_CALMI
LESIQYFNSYSLSFDFLFSHSFALICKTFLGSATHSKGSHRKGHRHHQLNEEQRQRILAQSSNYLDNSHLTDNGYKDSTFETLSLDSSDSMETNISACSPDNISSASTSNVAKIEEMERLLKEAQAEKAWLIETKVNYKLLCSSCALRA